MDDWKVEAKEKARIEKEKVKQMTFKQKMQYFWDYYKWVLALLAAVCVGCSIGHTMYRNSKMEHILDIALINSVSMGEETDDMLAEFKEKYDVDDVHRTISVDASYYIDLHEQSEMSQAGIMKLMMVAQADTVDVFIMPKDIFENYAKADMFADVRKILSAEMQEQMQENLAFSRTETDTADAPYGIMLKVADNPKLNNIFPYEEVYVTFAHRCKRPDIAEDFLKYLLP